MSAIAAAREASKKAGEIQNYLKGAVAIWKGTLICVQVADGLVYPAASSDPSQGDLFAGVAFESKAIGDASIRIEKEGSFIFLGSGFAQTDLGGAAYAFDDVTVLTSTDDAEEVFVGYIEEVIDSTHVRVRIDRAVQ